MMAFYMGGYKMIIQQIIDMPMDARLGVMVFVIIGTLLVMLSGGGRG